MLFLVFFSVHACKGRLISFHDDDEYDDNMEP